MNDRMNEWDFWNLTAIVCVGVFMELCPQEIVSLTDPGIIITGFLWLDSNKKRKMWQITVDFGI